MRLDTVHPPYTTKIEVEKEVVKEVKTHTYRLSDDPVCTHANLVFDPPDKDMTWVVTARFTPTY